MSGKITEVIDHGRGKLTWFVEAGDVDEAQAAVEAALGIDDHRVQDFAAVKEELARVKAELMEAKAALIAEQMKVMDLMLALDYGRVSFTDNAEFKTRDGLHGLGVSQDGMELLVVENGDDDLVLEINGGGRFGEPFRSFVFLPKSLFVRITGEASTWGNR